MGGEEKTLVNLLASSSSLYAFCIKNLALLAHVTNTYVSFLEPSSLDSSLLTLLVKSSFDFLLKDMQKRCAPTSQEKGKKKYL